METLVKLGILKKKYQGLVYELKGCQKSNFSSNSQTISCTLLITSTQENVELYLYSNYSGYSGLTLISKISRMFEAGQEYIATKVELGTSNSRSSVKNNLIKNVPIEGTITFDNVSLQVNNIDGLQISSGLISSYYTDYINVEFRNISVS